MLILLMMLGKRAIGTAKILELYIHELPAPGDFSRQVWRHSEEMALHDTSCHAAVESGCPKTDLRFSFLLHGICNLVVRGYWKRGA